MMSPDDNADLWAAEEALAAEANPDLMERWRDEYQDPAYDEGPGIPSCDRCGSLVTEPFHGQHNRWHRAWSLRLFVLHTVTGNIADLLVKAGLEPGPDPGLPEASVE